MSSAFLESLPVARFFGSDAARAVFDDRAQLQAWLDVEAALARAQARLGIIPADAAQTITNLSQVSNFDVAALDAATITTGHPLVPLVRALSARCGVAGAYVHLGATTQDVMDTGFVLCARNALNIVERECQSLAVRLEDLARSHRDSEMAGRTHGQQALPTTFGLRVAGWLDETRRHQERLGEMKCRLLVGSFGGAAGTMAGYGDHALALRAEVMKELQLGVPRTSWHANQDRFAECVALLGLIGSSAEKIAREIYLLGRAEIGELAEPQRSGQVGSSTMPQKQNPIMSEAVIAAAATLRAQVPLAIAAMVAQDDRDMGSGMILWKLIPEAFILLIGILERLNTVLSGLRVDTARMQLNLGLSNGLIVAEAVMLHLAGMLGREPAHHAVSDAVRHSLSSRKSFRECLLEHPALRDHVSSEALDGILDPHAYIGAAREIVDDVVGQVQPA